MGKRTGLSGYYPIAIPVSVIGLIGLWAAGWLFAYSKLNKWYAAALTVVLAAAINRAIDNILVRALGHKKSS